MVNKQFANAVHMMLSLAVTTQNQKKSSTTNTKKIEKKCLGLMNSEELAASAKTNAVVIRRLICSLSRAGLVHSVRGKSGGVTLAKDPHHITLNDIYMALDLTDAISHNAQPTHKECPVSCGIHEVITSISEGSEKALAKYLDSQKLSDLIKKI
jgi:Rrf2 family protein